LSSISRQQSFVSRTPWKLLVLLSGWTQARLDPGQARNKEVDKEVECLVRVRSFGLACLATVSSLECKVEWALKRLTKGRFSHEALEMLYVIGREYAGTAGWVARPSERVAFVKPALEVYLGVTHSARRTALACVFFFRRFITKDVARIIGRLVYASREQMRLWYLISPYIRKRARIHSMSTRWGWK
jgi:hypothetical protein